MNFNLLFITFISSFLLCFAQYPSNIDEEFNNFKTEYEKTYISSDEEEFRKGIFTESYQRVMALNAEDHSYSLGINEFSDMTFEEKEQLILTGVTPEDLDSSMGERFSAEEIYPETNLTRQSGESLDYRNSGSVTPVKHQGSCGSCWAFATAGSIEGTLHKLKGGQVVSLSEQEMVDCYKRSCGGDHPSRAFDYLIRNKRIALDSSSCYPYTSRNGRASDCKTYQSNCIGASPARKISTRRGDENDMKAHLERAGPISVGMHWPRRMQDYKGGIYDDPNCRNSSGLHAITLIGYGTESGTPFWLLKNSHGARWGDKGYFKLARNKNMCDVARWGVYASF